MRIDGFWLKAYKLPQDFPSYHCPSKGISSAEWQADPLQWELAWTRGIWPIRKQTNMVAERQRKHKEEFSLDLRNASRNRPEEFALAEMGVATATPSFAVGL